MPRGSFRKDVSQACLRRVRQLLSFTSVAGATRQAIPFSSLQLALLNNSSMVRYQMPRKRWGECPSKVARAACNKSDEESFRVIFLQIDLQHASSFRPGVHGGCQCLARPRKVVWDATRRPICKAPVWLVSPDPPCTCPQLRLMRMNTSRALWKTDCASSWRLA